MTAPSAPCPASEACITVCPDGPLLIRGPVQILDTDGQPLPRTRATIALCRCGKSRIAPLCDGTHKLTRHRSVGPAVDVAPPSRPPSATDIDVRQ